MAADSSAPSSDGPEQNAGDHLADDGRLMNLREEAGQDLTDDDHRAERDQYAKED